MQAKPGDDPEASEDPSDVRNSQEEEASREKKASYHPSRQGSVRGSQASGRPTERLPELGHRNSGLRQGSGLSGAAPSKKSGYKDNKLPSILVGPSNFGSPSTVKKKVTLPPEDNDASEEQDADAEMYESEGDDGETPYLATDARLQSSQKTVPLRQSSNLSRSTHGVLKNKLADSMINPLQDSQRATNGHVMADDNSVIPNNTPGQSNANKKSKLPVKVRFPDEESSSSKQSRSSKMSSFLDVDSKELNEEAVEEKAKQEYDRFYPIFKEVYKLRTLKKRGYKVNPGDFFMAYLQGIKKADQVREEEQKTKNKEFFDSVRKIIENQDKRTQQLMKRIEEMQQDRREAVEERIAHVGQFMLSDFKKQKDSGSKEKQLRQAQEKEYYNFLLKMGLKPNAMMQQVRLG